MLISDSKVLCIVDANRVENFLALVVFEEYQRVNPANLSFLGPHVQGIQWLDLSWLEEAIFILIEETLEMVLVLAPTPELTSIVNGNCTISVSGNAFNNDFFIGFKGKWFKCSTLLDL